MSDIPKPWLILCDVVIADKNSNFSQKGFTWIFGTKEDAERRAKEVTKYKYYLVPIDFYTTGEPTNSVDSL